MIDLSHIAEGLRGLAVEVDSLHADPANARKGHAVERIAASLRQYGQRKPIVVNRLQGNKVEAGNGTLSAARLLGWSHVAAVFVEDDAATATGFGIADNRTGDLSEWDLEALDSLLGSIDPDEIFTGFEAGELDDLLEEAGKGKKGDGLDAEPQIDRAEELRQEWGVELGQLWRLPSRTPGQEHRLICGDCTEAATVERVMGGEKASIALLDPPYGMRLDADFSGMVNNLKFAQEKGVKNGRAYNNVIGDHSDYDARLLLPLIDGVPEQIWFGANYYSSTLPDTEHGGAWLVWDKRLDESADKMFGSCFELIWSRASHKQDILRHKWASIFGTEHEPVRGRVHPNQKPVQLYTDLLSRYGGAIVIDPYAGSGNTIIAAENLSRQCLAVEISPGYVAVALQRYCDAFGITPELIA